MSSEGIPPSAASRGALHSHSFSTDAVAPRERNAFWKEAIFEAIANVEITYRNEEGFRGSIRWRGVELDGGPFVSLAQAAAMPQVASRGARQLAHQREPFLGLTLQKKGLATIEQGGHLGILRPGDINLLDITQPYKLTFEEPFEHMVLMIPYERLAPLLPSGGHWRGCILSGAAPLGSVLNAHMDAVAAALDRLDAHSRSALLERTIDLIALAFTDELNKFAGDASTVRRALALRITQFINRHLADPALSVVSVAAALGVSVGYLQHAFQATGATVGRYIRQRRLERCREDIANPLRTGEQIREVAMRWGFRDMPHFSRAFKEAFGVAPRDYRAARRRPER
ncbi:MAG: helix-turn-helix domain-containing protein [Rhodospirillaceae bacterium]|nr:helix-turn-helix domain-containing protein [Rhodospirillaceae bacterium]